MRPRARNLVIASTAMATCAFGLVSAASAATDPAAAPTFNRTTIDSALAGSAFSVSADVLGDVRPEIVATAFGPFAGPAPAGPGTVKVYNNAAKNKQGGAIDSWNATTIVPTSAGIIVPNQPTIADVDNDLDLDVIVPGGYFFDTYLGNHRGSITWWENRANGKVWDRHDVVLGSNFAYHSVGFADIDGDGISDLTSVGEIGGNPQSASDDLVELQYMKGLGSGNFAAPVKIGDGGGSLIQLFDVNGDDRLDVVSPQYFGGVAGQPFVPSFARDASVASFVWFEQTGDASGGLTTANFTKRAIGTAQGTAFSIKPVEDFRGDGVTRWIATNHTNQNIPFPPFSLYPKPAVYEFTPQSNPALPWTVQTLTQPTDFPVTGSVGQAGPGDANAGDIDGDGDLDLAVSGDGSRTVYWVEQKGDGTFQTNTFPNAVGYGQAGGAIVKDLNRDGADEVVFGSFDQNALSIWKR